MYTLEQRERAVELYVRYGRKATATMRELGYPKSRQQLRAWHREWEERGGALEGRSMQRYTDAQKRAAVDHYLEHGRCGAYARRELGYPKSWKKLKVARVAQPLDPGVRDPDLGELAGQPRPGEPGGVRPVGPPRPGLGARGHGAGGYRCATRVSPPESMRAGVKPVQPASYRPMRGPGRDDIHEAASAYGETPGKVPVAVSAWLSMPKTAEYPDMGPSRPRGGRAGRRLWWETFWTACRGLSRAGGRETPTRLSSRHIV